MGGAVQQLYGQPAVNSGMTDALNRMREAGITGSFTAGAALQMKGLVKEVSSMQRQLRIKVQFSSVQMRE